MPPHVPRKRLRGTTDASDGESGSGKKRNRGPLILSARRKPTLYDDLDATTTPLSGNSAGSIFQASGVGDDDSSLTSFSDEDFEAGPPAKQPQVANGPSEDEDEDFEFEDVAAPAPSHSDVPFVSGDLELTLTKDSRTSLANLFGDKKGPSKRERKARIATHSLHVLTLLWHNAIRNSWLCDLEVQATMISHLSPKMWDEIDSWRRKSGIVAPAGRRSALPSPKGKSGEKDARKKRGRRDWEASARKLEEGAVDLSHGDPLFRLMQSLASWWKQRFKITAPGLRKRGYMTLERLDRLTKAYKENFAHQDQFGERVASLDEFRTSARTCQGSRDIGAQLFTALLRGLSMEARMVASLQPLGFGWSKSEDADAEKLDPAAEAPVTCAEQAAADTSRKNVLPDKSGHKHHVVSGPASRRSASSKAKAKPDPFPDSEDELRPEYLDTDDESVVSAGFTSKDTAPRLRQHDADLPFPHYWTEVLSPVTEKYLPVDAIVKNLVATNRELAESFEPRGQRADKAKQVIAYVVGYSADGTAKDVTVRYLKRKVLPGRTKGFRMPAERVVVGNNGRRAKKYHEFDWFQSALSGYRRGTKTHPLTEIDDEEDAVDLKPAKAEKKEVKEGEETLQHFKQSKEFVLERHLKREEALVPNATPVRKFKNKAKGGKMQEEDVYLRSDVVQVKSAETWHKQGRAPLAGEQPLKRVPYRAATLNRKREILEAEAATGEKVLQGLFSHHQTDWIIPPPIENGVIPKNEYGNIDLFAEHMCPEGAVHVPFRGVVKVCKRLKIDYAEAVVDFEFGHRMAVPVIQGVVIAQEHHDQVMAELEKDEAERRRKEDEKRRKASLSQWRRFIMGLRIVERIRQDYGDVDENATIFGRGKATGSVGHTGHAVGNDGKAGGGFIPDGYEEAHDDDDDDDDDDDEGRQHHASGFFPVGDEEMDDDGDEGLTVEHY
ncbi:uncharacterized protein UV8b_04282 [Ustilaginoidea virens]|uniref:Uncharacterized protein n=1 Tax=Ustilaginoidea virens TaxID=1159556 RepID=A0A063C6Z1_USTVR|nr:uncharacterized protein UV8b_04282 [Ustilaginoidea virens]QUC20041.1 hypothetical protein UV8b_04282 [Ustilaginoidea virens]GAO14489.1 hypothetical protein UVI_02032010 [Ustilaginoidea virens]